MKTFAAVLLFAIGPIALAQTAPPDHVDWRSAGAVTPVKNQGQCGSDYAFATVAALEGLHKIASGHLLNLSEQELVDCSNVNGNQGCNGGMADRAMEWVVQHGIMTQAAYPYAGRVGSCKLHSAPAMHIGAVKTIATDANSLMQAVAKQPVAVLIDASGDFAHYEGGVYGCHAGSANHWVTIVGYGTTSSGQPYWIIKNSQGATWGESGFMRLTRAAGCKNIFAAFVPAT